MFTNKKSNILSIVKDLLEGKLSPISNAYAHMETMPPVDGEPEFMHEVWYENLDYDYANIYFKENYMPKNLGACSGIRVNNLVGRNFDWYYDNSAEFIVHTPNKYGLYKTIGVASMVPGLNEAKVKTHQYSDSYRILPFLLLDGINEHGLVVQKNVVPKEHGDNRIVNKGAPVSVCAPCLTRYLLDHYATVDEVVEAVCSDTPQIEIYTANYLEAINEELHFMISDATKSVIIEFIDGKAVPHYSDTIAPIMTNFHIHGVEFDENGKVPVIDGESKPTEKGITPKAAGLERYNILVDGKEAGINTVEAMENLMTSIQYTEAYKRDNWYSEFVGDYDYEGKKFTLTVDDTPEMLGAAMAIAKKLFENRSRETADTWQTVHTSIYDLSAKKLYVKNQEKGEFVSYDIEA